MQRGPWIAGAEELLMRHTARSASTWTAGVTGGILGGIAMAGCLVAAAALDGTDPLAPLRPLGETFAAGEPRGDGTGPLLLGLAVHLVFSAALGVLFIAVVPRDHSRASASFISMGFALFTMAVLTAFVLPAVNPALREEMRSLGGSWVLACAVYGAIAGFVAQHLRHHGEVPVLTARVRERTA